VAVAVAWRRVLATLSSASWRPLPPLERLLLAARPHPADIYLFLAFYPKKLTPPLLLFLFCAGCRHGGWLPHHRDQLRGRPHHPLRRRLRQERRPPRRPGELRPPPKIKREGLFFCFFDRPTSPPFSPSLSAPPPSLHFKGGLLKYWERVHEDTRPWHRVRPLPGRSRGRRPPPVVHTALRKS
jgi:hypothetical protein